MKNILLIIVLLSCASRNGTYVSKNLNHLKNLDKSRYIQKAYKGKQYLIHKNVAENFDFNKLSQYATSKKNGTIFYYKNTVESTRSIASSDGEERVFKSFDLNKKVKTSLSRDFDAILLE